MEASPCPSCGSGRTLLLTRRCVCVCGDCEEEFPPGAPRADVSFLSSYSRRPLKIFLSYGGPRSPSPLPRKCVSVPVFVTVGRAAGTFPAAELAARNSCLSCRQRIGCSCAFRNCLPSFHCLMFLLMIELCMCVLSCTGHNGVPDLNLQSP